ncbi:MAG: hypothetical protein LPH21_18785 [Shewanella sp.]|nr:hypothetical protein [Shewanella sp.]MCF1459516.1 hypothetical protein [Shewanella sp.]
MKKLLVTAMVLLLAGCGANVHRASGVQNEQHVIIVAESLVGKRISIGQISGYLISDSDLMPFQTGVAGVTDSELENSDVLRIKVTEGTNKLVLKQDGKTIFSKEIYLSAGQTRTIKL